MGSVQLFVERAQAVLPTFTLTAGNVADVTEICWRLDGIPLAIELAASRVRLLTPHQIASRLDDALGFLARQAPGELARRQTLRAALDWSYALLSQSERLLFDRLAIFAGSFTLEAAEAICTGHGILREQIVNLLAGLEDKSLVEPALVHGEVRFRLHEVIRQYAGAKLAAADDTRRMQARHLDTCARRVAEIAPKLTGPEQSIWLNRLEAEHDNLRAALTNCQATGASIEVGLGIVGGLLHFWITRGFLKEGRTWAKTLLAASDPSDATPGRLSALRAAAILARYQTDYAEARTLFEQALAVAQQLGDRPARAAITRELGNVAHGEGDYSTALHCYKESLALCREVGDLQNESAVHGNLGLVAWQQGDPTAGRRHLQACLAIRRELHDEAGIAYALHILADIAWSEGQQDEARSLNDESLRMRRCVGDKWGIAYSLDSLAVIAWREGDPVRARRLFAECLLLFHELGSQRGIADALDHLAGLVAQEGNNGSAAQIMAAASALRESIRASIPPNARKEYKDQLASVRAQLGDERFRAAWTLGCARTTDQAVRYALELIAL